MSTDELILLPDEFTQAAAQYVAAEPHVEVLDVDELTLHLRVRGREVTSELSSFYAAYRGAPEQLQAVWQTLTEALTTLPPDRTEDDPSVLLLRVMPMLKPIALLNQLREQKLPMLVYRPLVGELMVTYVIDEGQSVAFLNEVHLERWGVTEPLLWAQAVGNLRARPVHTPAHVIGSGAGSLLIVNGGDGYDATRVLLPELFSGLAARIPGRIVIGVPNRDFLIAFSDADRRIFDQVRAQIETDARAQEHPLTDQLLTYNNGALALYPGK